MSARLPVLLFVPGIRVKPPPEEQQEQLRRCLAAALYRQNFDNADALAEQLFVIGWSYHFYGIHGQLTEDMPGIERLLSALGDPVADREEANSLRRRIVAGFYAIGDRFPMLSSLFATRRMETRMAEINRYFRNQGGERDYMCNMLKEQLRAAWREERPVVLIGHSFGSVIAYDTLWELTHQDEEGANPKIDLFISMGSPLTMNYVRRRLQGAGRSGHERYPCNIRRWLNLAALGEVTALERRMASCFAPMLELGIIDEISDNLNLLNRFRGPDGLNVHKCYGYLASDALAETLIDFSRQA